MKSTWILAAAALLAGAAATTVEAADGCCDHCGRTCCVKKVCRRVPATRKIVKECYDCMCEDFCVPGPSCRDGRRCEQVWLPPHDGAPCCDCDEPTCCCIKWWDWCRRCAGVRTRNVLLKYEVEIEVPTCDFVVEYLCPNCCAACGADVMPMPEGPGPGRDEGGPDVAPQPPALPGAPRPPAVPGPGGPEPAPAPQATNQGHSTASVSRVSFMETFFGSRH